MDLEGVEPSTSSVRLKRAPNCATGPFPPDFKNQYSTVLLSECQAFNSPMCYSPAIMSLRKEGKDSTRNRKREAEDRKQEIGKRKKESGKEKKPAG